MCHFLVKHQVINWIQLKFEIRYKLLKLEFPYLLIFKHRQLLDCLQLLHQHVIYHHMKTHLVKQLRQYYQVTPSHAKNILCSNEKHQLKRETCHGHNYCQEKRLPRLSQF